MFRQGLAECLPRQRIPECRREMIQSTFVSISLSRIFVVYYSLDRVLQTHPRTPQRLHADEEPLVVEIRDHIFEPFPALPDHHIKRNLDVVIVHKGRPRGCRPGYGDVSRGEALLARDHYERELAVAFLDERQEVVRVCP